jgi:hypothetical protein
MFNGEVSVHGPVQGARLPGSGSGACWLVPCSPWPPPFAPPTPAPVARRRSPASQLLWRGLTSHARASPASAHHLPDADQGATALARREISRFPHKELTHMLGSTTAPGRPGARDDAPVHVAFRSMHSVGVPGVLFSRLNTQPMRTPVNASPSPSRGPTHDSGTVWFATPSLEETCTLYSLPVSRRTHCQLKQGWYASSVGGAVARCGEVLWTPIGLTPSQPRGAGKLTSTPLS